MLIFTLLFPIIAFYRNIFRNISNLRNRLISVIIQVEDAIEQLLVAQEQRIQFMWKREYHMEIEGIYDFRPAFVHPDLLIHSLTVEAATVAAGMVVDFGMAAIGTAADTAAQCAGLAPKDGNGSLFLDIGGRIARTVFLPSKPENLLDLTLCHRCLPSYQEDLNGWPPNGRRAW